MPKSKHRRKGKIRERSKLAIQAATPPSDGNDFRPGYYPALTERGLRLYTRLKEMYGENLTNCTDEQVDAVLAEIIEDEK